MLRPKVIIAWAVFLSIPLLGLWSHHVVEDRCLETAALVRQAIETYPAQASFSATCSAMKIWKDDQSFLTSFVTHEEYDEVTRCLAKAAFLFTLEEKDEYLEALNEALVSVEVVQFFDKPTLRGIF